MLTTVLQLVHPLPLLLLLHPHHQVQHRTTHPALQLPRPLPLLLPNVRMGVLHPALARRQCHVTPVLSQEAPLHLQCASLPLHL